MVWLAMIAQVDFGGIDGAGSLQDQLMGHATFIMALYGAVFVAGFALMTVFTLRLQSRPLDWSGPLARLASRPWSWRDAAIVVLPLLAAQLIFQGLYALNNHAAASPAGSAERSMLMWQGLLFHGCCFVLMLAVMRRRGVNWRQGFGVGLDGCLRHVVWGGLILVGIMPLIISCNLMAQVVMEWWGMAPQIQDVTRIIFGASGRGMRMYFVLLAVVIAPVVEEMLFRGMLLPAIARITGVRTALVVVALLFSLVHGLYMPAGIIFFILSIAFSLAYIYRGSLVTPVVMHALFNGMTMVVLLRVG